MRKKKAVQQTQSAKGFARQHDLWQCKMAHFAMSGHFIAGEVGCAAKSHRSYLPKPPLAALQTMVLFAIEGSIKRHMMKLWDINQAPVRYIMSFTVTAGVKNAKKQTS